MGHAGHVRHGFEVVVAGLVVVLVVDDRAATRPGGRYLSLASLSLSSCLFPSLSLSCLSFCSSVRIVLRPCLCWRTRRHSPSPVVLGGGSGWRRRRFPCSSPPSVRRRLDGRTTTTAMMKAERARRRGMSGDDGAGHERTRRMRMRMRMRMRWESYEGGRGFVWRRVGLLVSTHDFKR